MNNEIRGHRLASLNHQIQTTETACRRLMSKAEAAARAADRLQGADEHTPPKLVHSLEIDPDGSTHAIEIKIDADAARDALLVVIAEIHAQYEIQAAHLDSLRADYARVDSGEVQDTDKGAA
ncbi:MAG: hypothetical protein AAGI17_01990 [Planctomycetota bacterium]